ncbi:hypothetical protein [Streptosporangium sp. NPDC002721]|uniref:hypothetical protein n=1 Tax=Streptosporangium sp. NPDC002721 TaxID=3366188 RepID=UPI0036AE43F9
MRERLTADDLYAYVLMLKPVEKRAILIVEGDSDDAALAGHINDDEVNVIPGYGKGIIERVMSMVNDAGMREVGAVLDRDFGDIVTGDSPPLNTFYSDMYDLDATIFLSGSLCERVANNFSSVDAVRSITVSLGCVSIEQAVISLALPLGVLRLISVRDGLGLRLQDFPLGEVVADDCRMVDIEQLTVKAIQRSNDQVARGPKDLAADLMTELLDISDPKRMCSGHDLVRSLSVLLRKKSGVSMRPDTLERAFRAAFSCDLLCRTILYAEVGAWGRKMGREVWACDLIK